MSDNPDQLNAFIAVLLTDACPLLKASFYGLDLCS